MNKRIDTIGDSRSLARKIRNELDELEKTHHNLEEQIRNILNSTAELIQTNKDSTSAYVTERAIRLKDLMSEFQENRGYSTSAYAPLFRQVDRILDSTLSDYMSESLNVKMNRIAQSREPSEIVTGLNRFIYYRLGKMTFRIFGRLLEKIDNTSSEIAARLSEKYSVKHVITFFPNQGTDLHDIDKEEWKDLLLVDVPSSNRIFALWCDEIIRMDKENIPRETIFDLKTNHRLILGKILDKGSAVYVINTTN